MYRVYAGEDSLAQRVTAAIETEKWSDVETFVREQLQNGNYVAVEDKDNFSAQYVIGPQALESLSGTESIMNALSDAQLESLWDDLTDVPVTEDEKLEVKWMQFPAGTDKEEIWRFFDEQYSKGVYSLLYGSDKEIGQAEDWITNFSIANEPEFLFGDRKNGNDMAGSNIVCSYEADFGIDMEALLSLTDILSNYVQCETAEDYMTAAGHENEHQAYIHIYDDNSVGLGVQVTSPDGIKDLYDVFLSGDEFVKLHDAVERSLEASVPELKKAALSSLKHSKEDLER